MHHVFSEKKHTIHKNVIFIDKTILIRQRIQIPNRLNKEPNDSQNPYPKMVFFETDNKIKLYHKKEMANKKAMSVEYIIKNVKLSTRSQK